MRTVLCSARETQSRKALRYVMAPERFCARDANTVFVQGGNVLHELTRQPDGSWQCDCAFFRWTGRECAHTWAWQYLCRYGSIRVPESSEPELELVACESVV